MFSSTALDYNRITQVFCSTAQPNVNNQWADRHRNTMLACIWCHQGRTRSNGDNYTNSFPWHSNICEKQFEDKNKPPVGPTNKITINYKPSLWQQLLLTAKTPRLTVAPSAVQRLCVITVDRPSPAMRKCQTWLHSHMDTSRISEGGGDCIGILLTKQCVCVCVCVCGGGGG